MRAKIGLDPPERRIGLAAHDFAQALGAPEVMLTRAAKHGRRADGRLALRAAARRGVGRGTLGQTSSRAATSISPGRARSMRPMTVKPAPRPAPTPPPEARPDRLSVTDIENWLRDPYTIYARHVLNLRPLDPIDAEPGAADRGSVIHEAIGNFTEAYSGVALPADVERELIRYGEAAFAAWQDFPEARGFWWPRFKRIARWFAGWERERRMGLTDGLRRDPGRIENPAAGANLHAARTRRPHRTAQGRNLRHPRLQDRAAADRAAGAGGPRAAAHAGSGDPAPRRFCQSCGGLRGRDQLRAAARRRAARRTEGDQVQQRRHAGLDMPRLRWPNSPASPRVSSSAANPTARSCTRCGRSTTATTTIWRGSRNGRPPAAKANTRARRA